MRIATYMGVFSVLKLRLIDEHGFANVHTCGLLNLAEMKLLKLVPQFWLLMACIQLLTNSLWTCLLHCGVCYWYCSISRAWSQSYCICACMQRVQVQTTVVTDREIAWMTAYCGITLKTASQPLPFSSFCRKLSLSWRARLSWPLLRRAFSRASRVGQGWLGGAHFNHWLSISLK